MLILIVEEQTINKNKTHKVKYSHSKMLIASSRRMSEHRLQDSGGQVSTYSRMIQLSSTFRSSLPYTLGSLGFSFVGVIHFCEVNPTSSV